MFNIDDQQRTLNQTMIKPNNNDDDNKIIDEKCENNSIHNLKWPNLSLIKNSSLQWTKLDTNFTVTKIGHNNNDGSKFAMEQYLYINIILSLKNIIVSLAATSLSSTVTNVIYHYLVFCLVAFGFCCCTDLTATTNINNTSK